MSNAARPPGVPWRVTSSTSPARRGRVAEIMTPEIATAGPEPAGGAVAVWSASGRDATISRNSPLSGLLRTVT